MTPSSPQLPAGRGHGQGPVRTEAPERQDLGADHPAPARRSAYHPSVAARSRSNNDRARGCHRTIGRREVVMGQEEGDPQRNPDMVVGGGRARVVAMVCGPVTIGRPAILDGEHIDLVEEAILDGEHIDSRGSREGAAGTPWADRRRRREPGRAGEPGQPASWCQPGCPGGIRRGPRGLSRGRRRGGARRCLAHHRHAVVAQQHGGVGAQPGRAPPHR